MTCRQCQFSRGEAKTDLAGTAKSSFGSLTKDKVWVGSDTLITLLDTVKFFVYLRLRLLQHLQNDLNLFSFKDTKYPNMVMANQYINTVCKYILGVVM